MNSLRLNLVLLFITCSGLLSVLACDAQTTKKETIPLRVRNYEIYKAAFYITRGVWEKALPILVTYRGMCQSSDAYQNAAAASLLIAGIYEEQEQFEKGKRECKAGLKIIQRANGNINHTESAEDTVLRCKLLWKLANIEFYLHHKSAAQRLIEESITLSLKEDIRKLEPNLSVQLEYQKALMVDVTDRLLADELFKQSLKLRLRAFEKMSESLLEPVVLDIKKPTIPVFKPRNFTLTKKQFEKLNTSIGKIPIKCAEVLSRRGYFFVVYSPSTVGRIIQHPVKSPSRAHSSFNYALKSIQIMIDDGAKPKVGVSGDIEKTVFFQVGNAIDDYLGDYSQSKTFLEACCDDWKAYRGEDPRLLGLSAAYPAVRMGTFAQVFMGLIQDENPISYTDPVGNQNLKYSPAVVKLIKLCLSDLEKPVKRFPNYSFTLRDLRVDGPGPFYPRMEAVPSSTAPSKWRQYVSKTGAARSFNRTAPPPLQNLF